MSVFINVWTKALTRTNLTLAAPIGTCADLQGRYYSHRYLDQINYPRKFLVTNQSGTTRLVPIELQPRNLWICLSQAPVRKLPFNSLRIYLGNCPVPNCRNNSLRVRKAPEAKFWRIISLTWVNNATKI